MFRRVVSVALIPVWLIGQAARLPHTHGQDNDGHHGQIAHVHLHTFWADHQHGHSHNHSHHDHDGDRCHEHDEAGVPANNLDGKIPPGHHDEDAIPLPDCVAASPMNASWTVDRTLSDALFTPPFAFETVSSASYRGHPPPTSNSCPLYLEFVSLLI